MEKKYKIPCKIVKEPPRLFVSKDNHIYTDWNTKKESQIIDSKGVAGCNVDCHNGVLPTNIQNANIQNKD
jgi:hypothetical protein